jgi:tripartite-type tricarboxylate transporter receptor subunit TctC
MFSLHRAALALVLMCWAPILGAQSAYPTKPIHMVVPLAAGSAVDNAMRILTQRMSENMGQGIVIDNQPGAAGLIGAERVAKAVPDGYTIGGFNDSIMTMLPNLHAKLSWDILKDFEPVSLVATVEWGLVTSNDSPYRSAADLIAAAKANPGKINYGSGGNGSPQHVAMELFGSAAGISLTHVPYKGATQAAVGVAAGEVPVAFQGLATVAGLAKGGKLRLIAVTTPRRLPQFAEVPTVSESGGITSGHARAARPIRHADEAGRHQARVNLCGRADLSAGQRFSYEPLTRATGFVGATNSHTRQCNAAAE